MKILLISWYFPPINDIGAIRIARLAEFLRAQGHHVHILTGDRESPDKSLSTSFPEAQVTRAPWFDVNRLVQPKSATPVDVLPQTSKDNSGNKSRKRASQFRQKTKAVFSNLYVNLTWIPDHQVGWISYATRAGKTILGAEKFDFIYASGPPFSAFVVARSLSQYAHLPWVAEYRDGWSSYIYNPKPAWRNLIDRAIERYVTSSASAIVGVSQPWAEYYDHKFGKPTIAIYNGIDRQDARLSAVRPAAEGPLQIAYVGAMYGGLRDPSPLYNAITQLKLSPSQLQISFYGPEASEIYPLADKFGLSEFVSLNGRVSHSESLRIQREADILLLLQSPGDPKNVPAKFFEYLAARRPILGLGLDEGIPAKLT